MTDKQIKDAFVKARNLERFQGALAEARKDQLVAQKQHALENGKLEVVAAEAERVEEEIKKYRVSHSEFDTNRVRELYDINNEIEAEEKRLELLGKESMVIPELEVDVVACEEDSKFLPGLQKELITFRLEPLTPFQEKRAVIKSKFNDAVKEINRLVATRNRLKSKVGTLCPECSQKINEEAIADYLLSVASKIYEAQKLHAQLLELTSKVEPKLVELQKEDERLSYQVQECSDTKEQLARLKVQLANLKEKTA